LVASLESKCAKQKGNDCDWDHKALDNLCMADEVVGHDGVEGVLDDEEGYSVANDEHPRVAALTIVSKPRVKRVLLYVEDTSKPIPGVLTSISKKIHVIVVRPIKRRVPEVLALRELHHGQKEKPYAKLENANLEVKVLLVQWLTTHKRLLSCVRNYIK